MFSVLMVQLATKVADLNSNTGSTLPSKVAKSAVSARDLLNASYQTRCVYVHARTLAGSMYKGVEPLSIVML